MASEYGPEFDDYAKRCREELIPKVMDSAICVSIAPIGEADIKFCVELGVMICLDKPIILAVRPGAKVSEKLARVADEIVEVDFGDESSKERLMEAMNRVLAKVKPV